MKMDYSNAIVFKDVSFEYDGRVVLNDFSVTIKKGEHVCIMGESGVGKSTLLNSIVGLTVPNKGEIIINGIVVNPQNINAIRTSLVWLPQDVSMNYDSVEELFITIFKLKVNSNLKFNKNKLFTIFSDLGLSSDLYKKSTRQISGGEKQRILIALSILLEKEIMLFDEPTSAMDTLNRDKLVELFKTLNNTTILTITHDAQFAKTFDKVITL